MIISEKHKFIFVKTRKTAGTSLELAFAEICGSEDVVTSLGGRDEVLRTELGIRGPQNFNISMKNYGIMDYLKVLLTLKPRQFYNHNGAERIKQYTDIEKWNSFYKFTFDRNPWDKVISSYWFVTRGKISLEEYIISGEAKKNASNYPLYSSNGKLIVDKVYRYEDLKSVLKDLSVRFGLEQAIELPRAKGNIRKDKRPYEDVLTDELIQIIGEEFQYEIELLGYKPEQSKL
jgi:hypothetical protein